MFREISAWHLALILLAFVVLFGYKRLPDATRSLGRSMRIFKAEVKGLHDDEPKQVDPVKPAPTEPRAEAGDPETVASPEAVRATEPRVEPDRS
jgi:sec-independent protein translocase protein TatA